MMRIGFRHVLVRLPLWLLAAQLLLASAAAGAAGPEPVKVSVLKFGTVNWELDVIRHHGLDEAEGVTLEVTGRASTQATKVALQADAADIIVTDWIWVARQRAAGADFTFAPYSTALGALVVPADSPIRRISDLPGRRLGIAGGPLDKSWLLLRALAERRHGIDLDVTVDKVFGAPPLLNEQITAGRVEAVLTFWHFAARLEGAGMRRVVGVAEIARGLGIEAAVPMVGYAFRESWAASRRAEVDAFFRAVRRAKAILAESDAEWQRLMPLTRAPDQATLLALRDAYRAGIPHRWGAAERQAAGALYAVMRGTPGGDKLFGGMQELDDGTFWSGLSF